MATDGTEGKKGPVMKGKKKGASDEREGRMWPGKEEHSQCGEERRKWPMMEKKDKMASDGRDERTQPVMEEKRKSGQWWKARKKRAR